MYHYVSLPPPDADRYRRDLSVAPGQFEAQMRWLYEQGYTTITLKDLLYHLTLGWPLPEKPIILTFDDGYKDHYEVVFPILRRYGFVGTFFIITDRITYREAPYMTWEQVVEMQEAEMEIEPHSRTHPDLRGLSWNALLWQILGSKEAIEARMPQEVRFFCYPSGQYDEAVIRMLRATGYWGAVTTQYGSIHTTDGLFELRRIRIRGRDSLETFKEKVALGGASDSSVGTPGRLAPPARPTPDGGPSRRPRPKPESPW